MQKFDYAFLDNGLLSASVEAVLGAMVKRGEIQKLGGSRATRYIRT